MEGEVEGEVGLPQAELQWGELGMGEGAASGEREREGTRSAEEGAKAGVPEGVKGVWEAVRKGAGAKVVQAQAIPEKSVKPEASAEPGSQGGLGEEEGLSGRRAGRRGGLRDFPI